MTGGTTMTVILFPGSVHVHVCVGSHSVDGCMCVCV